MKRSHGQLFRAGGRKGKIYKMAGLPSTAPTTAERSEGDGRPREKARPGREVERAGRSLPEPQEPAELGSWQVLSQRCYTNAGMTALASSVNMATGGQHFPELPFSILVQRATPAPLRL